MPEPFMPRALVALLLLLLSPAGAACVCPAPSLATVRDAENALFRSDVVAVMTIRAIREITDGPDAGRLRIAELEPVERFKGGKKIQPTYTAKVLATTHDPALVTRVGMQWLVYLRGKEALDFTRCGQSGPVALREGELANLRQAATH
jgi:hypothetical protein